MSETEPRVDRSTDASALRYAEQRRTFWEGQVGRRRSASAACYHERLAEVYRFLVPAGLRVLEVGCGNGDLLAALEPARGVGIDFSPGAISAAQQRHPDLEFHVMDAHSFDLDETFDVIVLSDLLNDVHDVQAVLERLHQVSTPSTRVVMNFFNRVWQGPMGLARRLGLAAPTLKQNWLSTNDLRNLVELAGFEVVTKRDEILLPIPIAPLATFLNRVVVKFWPFNELALTGFLLARPAPTRRQESSVSVVCPARNESGNVEDIIERTPMMGLRTELIFVEGNSSDDTYEVIRQALEKPGREHVSLYRQPGKGKGDAVREGYAHATGDVLMILDADMTVPPEELPRFYEAIANGSGELINGVRLVYPMESEAMRTLNYMGNKFFSMTFSWILRQPVKDTLCGTKVLTRDSYDVIAANRSYFGDFDPFGDFDLLFGASKSNLRIVDLPVRYRDRTYGDTNISRWKHGVLLLRMAAFAARKLRFT